MILVVSENLEFRNVFSVSLKIEVILVLGIVRVNNVFKV